MSLSPKSLVLLTSAIVLSAAVIRFTHLTNLPVFADESIYIRWAQVMRAEPGLRFLPLSDGKQPLFMWLIIPFFKLFSDPLIAGRVVSGLAGLGTILGVGVAGYLLFRNFRLALGAAFIYTFLPYAVFFDRMALADSLLTMFLLWTFNFSLVSFQSSRWDFSMLAGFSLGFAWLTKSPAVFGYILIPGLLLTVYKDQKSFLKKIPLYLGLIFTIYIISFVMYNILRLGPEFHQIALRNRDYLHPLAEILRHPLDPLIPHLKDVINFFFHFLTPLGLVLMFIGLINPDLKHLRQRTVLGLWLIFPVIVQSAFSRTLTARYLLFTVPYAVLLLIHAVWHIGDRTKSHLLSLAALLLVGVSGLLFDGLLITNPQSLPLPRIERSGYLELWTAGFGISEVSRQIRQVALQGPVVVGSEGFFGTPFSALQMYLNDLPQVRVVGIGQNIAGIDQKLINATADNRVYLVANSSRMLKSPDELGLTLLGSYPKAQAPDGSREYLLFMEIK